MNMHTYFCISNIRQYVIFIYISRALYIYLLVMTFMVYISISFWLGNSYILELTIPSSYYDAIVAEHNINFKILHLVFYCCVISDIEGE